MFNASLWQILYSFVFYLFIIWIKPGLLAMYIIITALLIGRHYYRKIRRQKTKDSLGIQLINAYIFITILYIVAYVLGPWGIYGSVVIVLGLACYMIIKQWRAFVAGLRDIEIQIWGRSLDKKNWVNCRPTIPRLVIKKNTTGVKKMELHKKPINKLLAWVSVVCFVILGALALTDNLMAAFFALHNGLGAVAFAGYLAGLVVVTFLALLVPLVMMVTYIRHLK